MKFALTGDWHYGFSKKTHGIIERFLQHLAKQDFDVLLLSGDIISHDQTQWEPVLRLLRTTFKDTAIYFVMGNHDYWTETCTQESFLAADAHRRELFRKHNIRHLEGEVGEVGGVQIFGFGGWYWSAEPPSNDVDFIPRNIGDLSFHDYLLHRAQESVDEIVSLLPYADKAVILTHFEMNDHPMGAIGEWLDRFIAHRCKGKMVIACGHTHLRRNDDLGNGISLVNAGGDYDNPSYRIIEL